MAFTDSDCRADADWLYYLVGDLLKSGYTGIGGHNFLPPDDSAFGFDNIGDLLGFSPTLLER